jgi:hypothetical protein
LLKWFREAMIHIELIRKPWECGRIGKKSRKEERRPWQEHAPGK